MRHTSKIVAFGMLLFLWAPFAVAQAPTGRTMDRWGPMMGEKMPRYDPATEMTVKGIVEAFTIRGYMYMHGVPSTRLTVKTEKGTMEVRVGPTWFLEQNKMTFVKGDQVAVTGSHVTFETREWLIAREVQKGGQTLTLRDKNGDPAWFSKAPDWRDRIGMPRGIT